MSENLDRDRARVRGDMSKSSQSVGSQKFWFRLPANIWVVMKHALTEPFDPHLHGGRISLAGICEDSTLCSASIKSRQGRKEDKKSVDNAGIKDKTNTHWYSGNSVSKSTLSTPTSSRLSSTIVARNWSVANSRPKKRA